MPRQIGGATHNSSGVASTTNKSGAVNQTNLKPGQSPSGNKATFVVCEICDGYIKDLDQLRNHMQWIHKVKVCITVLFVYENVF